MPRLRAKSCLATTVTLAQAGVPFFFTPSGASWIPAFAGMTSGRSHASRQRHRAGLIVALASCREEWNNASHAKPME
jgi:hypothetical protein